MTVQRTDNALYSAEQTSSGNAIRQVYDADVDEIITLASALLSHSYQPPALAEAPSLDSRVFSQVESRRIQKLEELFQKFNTQKQEEILMLCQKYLQTITIEDQKLLLQSIHSTVEESGIAFRQFLEEIAQPNITTGIFRQLNEEDKHSIQLLIKHYMLGVQVEYLKAQETERVQFIYDNTMGEKRERGLFGARKSEFEQQRYEIELCNMEQVHQINLQLFQNIDELAIQNWVQPANWQNRVMQLEEQNSLLEKKRGQLEKEKEDLLLEVSEREKAYIEQDIAAAKLEMERQLAQFLEKAVQKAAKTTHSERQDTSGDETLRELEEEDFYAFTEKRQKSGKIGTEKKKRHCTLM